MTINNKIRVTNFAAVNSTNFPTRSSVTNPTGWTSFKVNQSIHGSATGTFIANGTHSSATAITKLLRTTDFITWSEITTPAIIYSINNGEYGRQVATNQAGTWLIVSGGAGAGTDNKSIVSTDDGLTWSSGGNLPSTSAWVSLTFGTGSTYMAFRSTNAAITTNNGTSWSAVTSHSMGFPHCVYGGGRWLLHDGNSGTSVQHSDNNGTTWSVTRTCPQFSKILYINGKFYGIGVPTASVPGNLYASSDLGVTWSAVATFNVGGSIDGILLAGGRYYLQHSQTVYSSTDLINWKRITEMTGDSNIVNTGSDVLNSGYVFPHRPYESTVINFVPVIAANSTTGIYYENGTTTINNGNSSYIDVTAAKGSLTRTIRVPVVKDQYTADINTMSLLPGSIILNATSDGVVDISSLVAANVTISVFTNGIDTTSSWTLSKVNGTGVTSTLTGSNLKIDSLATANDVSTVVITASNTTTGKVLNATVNVSKNKGLVASGPTPGAFFTGFSTTQTRIYIKFLTTGIFQIKNGSGGSYVNAGTWHQPVNATSPPGSGFYIYMSYTSSTSDTLTNGTNGTLTTWSQLNVDREWYLDNTASGTHIVSLKVYFSTVSTGNNAVLGNGELTLVVP